MGVVYGTVLAVTFRKLGSLPVILRKVCSPTLSPDFSDNSHGFSLPVKVMDLGGFTRNEISGLETLIT